MKRLLLGSLLVAGVSVLPAISHAEEAAPAEAKKEAAPAAEAPKAEEAKKAEGDAAKPKLGKFEQALQKADPEAFKKFMALRSERDVHRAKLKSLRKEIQKASSEEKINLYQQYKAASKAHAKVSVGLIEFLDQRDRDVIEKYKKAIERLKGAIERLGKVIETRGKIKADFEKQLKEE